MNWISVKDRLPKEYEHVLVAFDMGYRRVREGYLSHGPYKGFETEADGYVPLFCDATEWYGEEGWPEDRLATHWMPMPSPPDGDPH